MGDRVLHVLVTGATRGLGFELARLLLRAGGYHVIATGRSWGSEAQARLSTIANTISNTPTKRSTSVTFITADLASHGSRASLVDGVVASVGTQKLHCIVNSAGIFPQDWSRDAYTAALLTNTVGPLALADELRSALCDGAHVVNVTSGYGLLRGCSPFYKSAINECRLIDDLATLPFKAEDEMKDTEVPAYKVSKAALNRGTQILSESWRGTVRVNSVDPGWCRTDMGGPCAPRSALDGARSIFAVVIGDPLVIGTGRNFNQEGKAVGW